MKKDSEWWKRYNKCLAEVSYEIWGKYFWVEDQNSKVNATKENVQYCHNLYSENPEDINNALRLVAIQIFSGVDFNDLFSVLSHTRDCHKQIVLDIVFWDMLLSVDLRNNNDRLIFAEFILWYISNNKELIEDHLTDDPEDLMNLRYVCNYCDPEKVFDLLDLNSLIRNLNFTAHDDDCDLEYYVLAEYYYSKERWFDAFCFYEKVKFWNENYEKVGMVFDLKGDGLYSEIARFPATAEDIRARARESFNKAIATTEADKIYDYLNFFYWQTEHDASLLREKNREINTQESYLRISRIFMRKIIGNDKEAYDMWNEIKNNLDEKQMCDIDPNVIERFLKSNMIQNDKKKQQSVKRSYNEIFYPNDISAFERKIREFIRGALEERFGIMNSWNKGVPIKIRQKASSLREEDPKASKWRCLEFVDYAEIICFKDNWKNIFKIFFNEKNESRSIAEKRTSFLRKLPRMRNVIMHDRRPLNREERKGLITAIEIFEEIYERWQEVALEHKKSMGG